MTDDNRPADPDGETTGALTPTEATPAPAPTTEPAPPAVPEGDYTAGGVPTFDFVRDKIENRHATAVGGTEVAGLGTENTVEEWDRKLAETKQAGRDRLAEIRKSMNKDS